MITEAILTALFVVADFFLALLPEFEWTLNTAAWSGAGDVLSMICYLLPLQHIIGAMSLIISLVICRIGVSLIRVLLGLIPFF